MKLTSAELMEEPMPLHPKAISWMRWRLHDPAEGPYRWSRAHLVHFQTERAVCGVTVAWNAYMVDWEEYLPADAPRCKSCLRRGGAEDR